MAAVGTLAVYMSIGNGDRSEIGTIDVQTTDLRTELPVAVTVTSSALADLLEAAAAVLRRLAESDAEQAEAIDKVIGHG
jgi:hypothetical protein